MLIIATKSPFIKALPQSDTGATLLLSQDSVIAVTATLQAEHFVKVYALESDLAARGLTKTAQQNPMIEIINLQQFVQLTINHHPIMNW